VYRIGDLLGLWSLALLGLAGLGARWRAGLLAAWIAAAGAYNFAYVVRPAADPITNGDLVEARWTSGRVPSDAWIVATSRGAVYLPYFAHLRTVNLRYLEDEDALYARLDALAAAGAEVYVTDRTLERAGQLAVFAAYGLRQVSDGDGLALYRVARQISGQPIGSSTKKLKTAPAAKNGPKGIGSERLARPASNRRTP